MAEDSGAFKTNQRNSAQIGHFVIARERCGKDASPPEKHGPTAQSQAPAAYFVTNSVEALRYSRIGLIRGVRSWLCGHRVPFKPQRPDPRPPPKAEPATMLPGFRFLFTAIVLSMSILVFGLGAAALLRAAHEEFASMPSRRAPPEPVFAQPSEAPAPTLALLRFDPPVAEKDNVPVAAAPDEPAADAAPPTEPATIVSAPAEPAASASTPVESEKIATLKSEDSPQETAKPEIPIAETSPQSESAPAQADAPAPADETKIAASEHVSSPAQILAPASEAALATSEQASAAILTDPDLASTKIATLGGPPVTIETTPPAKAASAKPDESVIKKRLQARRAAQRRRIALRARVARQAPAQPAPNAFSQPTITVRSRSSK